MKKQGTDVSPGRISRRQFFDGLTTAIQGLIAFSLTYSSRLLARSVEQLPLGKLKTLIGHRVISRTDSNYEVIRQSSVWQMIKPDRFPALIVQAQSVNDIKEPLLIQHNDIIRVTDFNSHFPV